MLPERMEDDGLLLRRWGLADAEALAATVAESASHLRPWVTWVDEEPTSIEGWRMFIAEREREWQDGGAPADSGTDLIWRRTGHGSQRMNQTRGPSPGGSASS